MQKASSSSADLRTFTASDLASALDLVRGELGPDAVILETREIPRSRWQFWKRGERQIEVVAGLGLQTPPRFPLRPLDATLAAGPGTPAGEPRLPQPPLNRPTPSPATHRLDVPPQMAAELAASQAELARQLSSLQQMVAQLSRNSGAGPAEVTPQNFEIFTRLIDADVDEELARELVAQLPQTVGAPRSFEAARPQLQELLERGIRCSAPLGVTPGRRKVVALVGPTGVGKTTTIAKLAANLRLRDGVRLGLVTVDTYRIAAVEQLRTYAEIMDLPMKVVTTPREMRTALDELAGLDLVLIDTAGRSPRDELKIQELRALLAEARVDEVHLVLSLVSSLKSLVSTAAQFLQAGATSLILTKLDEALGMGALASAARRIDLPISYLTTGQDVPDDMEQASARRIARLVLGDEQIGTRLRNAA